MNDVLSTVLHNMWKGGTEYIDYDYTHLVSAVCNSGTTFYHRSDDIEN